MPRIDLFDFIPPTPPRFNVGFLENMDVVRTKTAVFAPVVQWATSTLNLGGWGGGRVSEY